MKSNAPQKRYGNCESCEFYDYDEYYDDYYCKVNIDQDERESYISGSNNFCPYYRFYDEYKSVQKQN